MKRTLQFIILAFLLFLANRSPLLAQWVQTNGAEDDYITCFAVSGMNLYAGTSDNGVFLSTNDGANWTSIGLMNILVYDLAVSGTNLIAGTINGVFLSTNNGISWVNPYPLPEVLALVVSDTNLFAGTFGLGVFRSTDGGTSWESAGFLNAIVYSLIVSGPNLFAGTQDNGVLVSTDNGTNWVNTGLVNETVAEFAVSGINLFAGTFISGVFLSTDNGTGWTPVNAGLTSMHIYTLALSTTNLFAGTETDGVFLSTNNGTNWTPVNAGLTNTFVVSLAIIGTNLFAGTAGGGIWRRPLSEMVTSVESIKGDLPVHFSLEQNYPNPFNATTNISFALPSKAFVSLRIYDGLGRELATLVSDELTTGIYSIQWTAVGLASGVYFYQLQAESFVETKKLLLLR